VKTTMESKNEVHMTGRLASVTVEPTKNGKEIAKLIVETDAPEWMNTTTKDQTQVIVFGKSIELVRGFKAGDLISVLGRVRGREYNGKWYTDVIGEKFKQHKHTTVHHAAPPPSDSNDDDLLF